MINKAKYVWFSEKDTSRNPYAAFRKTFEIKNITDIKNAEFNIFADTVYQLYVNGKFTGFGPARFDPKYPQYDSYDLMPHLANGRNLITVLANFHGHKTFRNVPEQAAMIAWGTIKESGSIVDLSTNSENWKCAEYAAHTRCTPKLSFALNAQIFYDQSKFDENWIEPEYDDSNWENAIELKEQGCFGELIPREIPFMSMESVPVAVKTRVFPLDNREDLYSFYMELPYSFDTEKPKYSDKIAWSTYIYSPREQALRSAVLYDAVWVNGEICEHKFEDESKPLRYNFVMHLKEGWNYIFGTASLYQDIFECYLSLPKDKGLLVSAERSMSPGKIFRHTKIMLADEYEKIKPLLSAQSEDAGSPPAIDWVYLGLQDKAQSPCREASWDTYSNSIETVEPAQLKGFIFRKSIYPDGFTLIFDMEHMRLVFPHFVFKGVKGATIDLLYSDRYMPDGKHVRQQSWVPLGERLICSNDTINWLPIQPRGFKYLNITVRNTKGDVTLENIDFISAHYPVKKSGSFECSDPALTNIWKMCALTQEVNMEDAYDDCVDRERGLYVLDTLIQYHNNLACFGDHKLMKRCLELYAQSIHENGMYRCIYPNTGDYILPDFSLYAVEAFYSYYLYTGDKKLIETWWNSIITNMNVFNALSDEREDYLLCADPPEFSSETEGRGSLADKKDPNDKRTGHLGDGGWTNNKGINCIFSCLYLIALRGTQFLAEEINKTKDCEDIKKRISALETSIPKAFWNEEKGLFADNTGMLDFSPHASLFAVRAGVVSNTRLQIIRKNLEPLLTPFFKNGYDRFGGTAFSTSYGYYMLDSLYKAGMYHTAENCMREGWGWFLSKGLRTTSEHWDLEASQCHAWTSSPAYIMSRYILGINFDVTQGLNRVTIDVKPGSIKWARGKFPHPLGDIEIHWHRDENGGIIFDKLDFPAGVEIHTGLTNEGS